MHLWDLSSIVNNLKNNTVPESEIRLYYALSPLLSIANGVFFGALLFGHHIVEYSFHGWLKNPHPNIDLYNLWAFGLTFLTASIAALGMYLCYRTNQKGDGKNFWQRMAYLSFPINFHITFYSLIALGVCALFGYFFLQTKITAFRNSVWPSEEALNTVIKEATKNNPFGQVVVKTASQPASVWTTLIKSPSFILWAPLIPMKIKAFAQDLRTMILMAYPLLSILPVFLSLLHYMIVRRMIKIVAGVKS